MGKDKAATAIYTAYDDSRPLDPAGAERNLLRAVLMTALSDLRKPGESKERAKQYFLSEEEDYIFSFRSICDYLNVDPNKILTVNGIDTSENLEEAEKSAPQGPQPRA